jgi:hypothetical protein
MEKYNEYLNKMLNENKYGEDNIEEFKGFKVGDRVGVKHPEQSYDGLGEIDREDVGTIKSFAPKVRIGKMSVIHDKLPYFAFVIFDREVTDPHPPKGATARKYHLKGGIDIINLKKVKG